MLSTVESDTRRGREDHSRNIDRFDDVTFVGLGSDVNRDFLNK